jgi:hypothetical protein
MQIVQKAQILISDYMLSNASTLISSMPSVYHN